MHVRLCCKLACCAQPLPASVASMLSVLVTLDGLMSKFIAGVHVPVIVIVM